MDGLIFMQTAFFSGGGFGQVLSTWEAAGVFDYLIPFLLIFSVVYGILIQMKLFGGKTTSTGRILNGIISLAVGLMSLQFDFVPIFFREIFPRVGIGLVVLLLFIIFTGLFADPRSKGMMYTMYGIGAAILVIILARTSQFVGWFGSYGISRFDLINWLPWIILIGAIVAIISSGKKKPQGEPSNIFSKLLSQPLDKE